MGKNMNLDHVIINVAILVDYKAFGEKTEENKSEYPKLKAPEGITDIAVYQLELFICFSFQKEDLHIVGQILFNLTK